MGKLKNTLARISSISFERLRMCIARVHVESGRAKFRIFFDMLWCYLRYGVGYLDYLTFGFVYQDGAHRKTFMNMNQNIALVRALNNANARAQLDDKGLFNARFAKQLGRAFIDLREAGEAEFAAFLSGAHQVFAKAVDQFGGKGVERVVIDDGTDIPALYSRLVGEKKYDVEQAIVQHPEMNRLSDRSVNSLRMVTLLKDGAHLMYTLVRMGDGRSAVDNISSGGMYCPVNTTGVITAPAFRDLDATYYDRHPATGTEFAGFTIPYYNEAVALVKEAAVSIPELRYIGWDVAIAESGPVLIEGNVIPGYDMPQNYRHLGPEKIGILPAFREVLRDEAPF